MGSTINNIVDYALNDKFTEEVTWVDVDHKVLNNYLQSAEGVTFPEGPIADSALKDSLRNVRA